MSAPLDMNEIAEIYLRGSRGGRRSSSSYPSDIERFAVENYGGNPAGGTGLGSYTRQQYDADYFGAAPRQAAIGQMFQQRRDQAQMAEMAAQRLERLGGEQASFWAGQIRQNPRAAIQLAEQYGGFPAIEQGIMGSRKMGAMQEAIGRAATPEDIGRVILQTQGAEAYKAWAQGRKAVGESLNPSGPLDIQAAMKLRKDYSDRAENFATIRHFYDVSVANAAQAAKDSSSPGAVDFALVQSYGKMLDPDSVVRNEEGRFIADSQSSTVRDKMNQFLGIFNATGELNPQARLNLMRQIEATYRGAEEKHAEVLAEMNQELDSIGAQGVVRDIAMPIGIQPSTSRLDLAPWESALQAQSSSGPTPEDVSKMREVTLPDGRRMRRDADGNWEPVQ